MKKVIIMFSIFTFMFLSLIFISREIEQDLEIIFVDELDIKQNTILVCVEREDGRLVLVDVELKNNEDIYLYVLKVYDHHRNSLPLTYKTPLKGNFEILSLDKINDKLFIEVKTLYLYDDINRFLTALMWTYQGLGINSVEMKINGHKVTLHKDNAINLVYESSIINAKYHQIIYYYQDTEIIPVTYIHSENPVDFIMQKIISKSMYSNVTYSYETIDNNLILEIFDEKFLISKEIINNILKNLINLAVFENIIIIKNEVVVANN